MADLEATVDRLVIEAEEVMEAKDRLEREFELSKEENLALGEENERLVIELRDYQAHFQEAEDIRTAHNEQLQAEHLALQSELEMWQCRCREVEASRERAAQKYIEERAALLDELSDVNKRLVESNAEISAIDEANENLVKHQNEDIDRLTSEFHALQLEREHDRKALSDTERAFSKLRSDAKEKLKHLVKQKQAASMTIEKLKKDNAAHAESNRHLRNRIERAERGRDSLQQRVTGLEERLEVEQLARREAEDRIQKLESRPTTTESEIQMDCAKPSRRRDPHQGENTEAPEIQMDQAKTSRRWDPHQEQYTEAELALLKEIQAEKLSKDCRDGGFENDQAPLSAALGEGSRKWQRADFGRFRRHLDAKYGNPDTPDFVPVETYHAECARRIQAEDLVATMAAHAKEGLEKRNKEIMSLKLRLSSEVDEKESEILSLRTQLHALRRKSLS
jgi:chromosome segregation ATPase